MSCKGVHEDNYDVFVRFQQPETRRARCCIRCCGGFMCLSFIFVLLGPLLYVLSLCHGAPGIALEDLSIHDMAVFHNVTSSTPWQVNSDINVTLSMRNPNTLPRCFTTFRRMDVSVKYKGNSISRSEIPLGFSLKPGRSREVSAELKGERFQLTNELGPRLEAESRSENVTLVFDIDTRYLISDRRSYWTHKVCKVAAKTPLESSRLGSQLSKYCEDG